MNVLIAFGLYVLLRFLHRLKFWKGFLVLFLFCFCFSSTLGSVTLVGGNITEVEEGSIVLLFVSSFSCTLGTGVGTNGGAVCVHVSTVDGALLGLSCGCNDYGSGRQWFNQGFCYFQ